MRYALHIAPGISSVWTPTIEDDNGNSTEKGALLHLDITDLGFTEITGSRQSRCPRVVGLGHSSVESERPGETFDDGILPDWD